MALPKTTSYNKLEGILCAELLFLNLSLAVSLIKSKSMITSQKRNDNMCLHVLAHACGRVSRARFSAGEHRKSSMSKE
jgi:hypothetical protein